jgi:DNA modification methylase
MPDNSVDAIVTDPPYGLAFMGKKWDYDVPSEEIWRECLRVLKPGGHLLAFAGTRTQHRMAVRIEDAGFEIRDMIAWVYGSGFPKSLDVSKAIDKMDASEEQELRRLRFTAWVRSTGITSRQIDEATGTNMGGHYTTAASQPAIMTREHLEQCRHLLGDVPEWVECEADIRSVESKNFAEREVVGKGSGAISTRKDLRVDNGTMWGAKSSEFNLTAPATPAAIQWQGWGTALKPALEPITVARKPFTGTVANNVLTWGTGGVNVDGCRVGLGDDRATGGLSCGPARNGIYHDKGRCERATGGRWPANLIHDGSEEVVGLFPETKATGRPECIGKKYDGVNNGSSEIYNDGYKSRELNLCYSDSGSAARFFYCAKASKADRGDGNHHPTVKPTDLMRYLCRLVTPADGIVLDPFMGSGSTGKAAILEGFQFIGIDMTPEYVDIARARIEHAFKNKQNTLDL